VTALAWTVHAEPVGNAPSLPTPTTVIGALDAPIFADTDRQAKASANLLKDIAPVPCGEELRHGSAGQAR
jgi:hypothetical protein